MPKPRRCKDCLALPPEEQPKRPRDADYRGPRCYLHHKARQRHVKTQAHQRYTVRNFGLPAGFYDALYEAQGGRCAWCAKASGAKRKLAVDHDHSCCPGTTSCGKCARGLLCADCNQFLGFRMGDDPERIRAGARYLEDPPAQRLYMSWTPAD